MDRDLEGKTYAEKGAYWMAQMEEHFPKPESLNPFDQIAHHFSILLRMYIIREMQRGERDEVGARQKLEEHLLIVPGNNPVGNEQFEVLKNAFGWNEKHWEEEIRPLERILEDHDRRN